MALGWLWVSTLKQTLLRPSNSMMPALSLKTLTHQGRASSSVARAIVDLRRLRIVSPRKRMSPVRVLCLQCSLQVCATVSSSTSVGSRRRRAK